MNSRCPHPSKNSVLFALLLQYLLYRSTGFWGHCVIVCISHVDILKICPQHLRGVIKKNNGLFTVRLTVRGGEGGSATSALTVSICENIGPISPLLKWYNKSKYVNLFWKNHETLTVRGGGGGVNPYGQPDRKKTFFLWRLPLGRPSKKNV